MTSTLTSSSAPTTTSTTTAAATFEIQSISSFTVPPQNYLSSTELCNLPNGTIPLENQVAGHTFQEGTNSLGLLKDQNTKTVLKPASKPICGIREINFYKTLQEQLTNNSDLIELKRLVPEFKGTVRIKINNKETEFIRLEDLTYDMSLPCIMDIKIGKRTWDPEATLEKIQAEEEKYLACKKTLGLCIPGFQVYSIKNHKLLRFSKEYGKSLNPKTFIDTIKLFLNYDYELNLCYELVNEILLNLLKIKNWSIKQKTMKLYSSSILIVYDAKRLMTKISNFTPTATKIKNEIHNDYCNHFNCNNKYKKLNGSIHHSSSLSQSPTINNSLPSEVNNCSLLQNQKIIINHILNNKLENSDLEDENHTKEYHEKLNGLTTHHYNHNRDDNNDQSTNPYSSSSSLPLVRVKMIDFAHVFPTTDNTIDTNYLFGIENLVKIFEDLLNEISSSSLPSKEQ